MKNLFWKIFGRRVVKVSVICNHGGFIPGVFRPGNGTRIYSCDDCGLRITLQDHRGPINW